MTDPLAATFADWAARTAADGTPAPVAHTLRLLILDVAGLCLAARGTDYVAATRASTLEGGCTALGHAGGRDPYGAALINGTAAHGEDFDDTFEGGPIHGGAVVLPAVLAAAEHRGRSGADVLAGTAVGIELMCRLSLVTPKAIHKAGFHPTAVIGTLGAALGVGTALGLDRARLTNALGIAGSLASGIIEYLAEGTWTKRMHAGWAAQSGIRAALMAEAGFVGPRTVLEGEHGFFKAFAPSRSPDFDVALGGLSETWKLRTIAFKPYACGTMTQPYVDAAIELAERGIAADEIEEIVCEVGEGTVHRLWEPLGAKQRPSTPYGGKFSTPFCMAVAFFDRAAGLAQFTDARIADPAVQGLAAKIRYVVDPENPYPDRFTGHLEARLRSGDVIEIRRANMRGGAHLPLGDEEIAAKFRENAAFGGWDSGRTAELEAFCLGFDGERDLGGLARFRG